MNNNNHNANMSDHAARIRELTFVQKELELYLDTHPNCKTALDYYYQTMNALRTLTEEHEAMHGPLTSRGVMVDKGWTWVAEPWPWQREGDYMQPRKEK